MSAPWAGVRHGFRLLARSPDFTVVAVSILALAVAANTTVFSVVDGVLLKPLPYHDPDRVVDVAILPPPREGSPNRKAFLEAGQLEALRESSRTIEHLAAYRQRTFVLTGRAEQVRGAAVSPALFPLLGVAPLRGRPFREEEQVTGAENVVLLSHGFWHRRLQGSPAGVGDGLTLDGVPHSIVGVMPEGFSFPDPSTELWTPLVADSGAPNGTVVSTEYLPVVGRLRDGVTLRQAEAEAGKVLEGTAREGGSSPESPAGRVRVVPLRESLVEGADRALLMLSMAVGLVLLIACVNLAGLLWARSSTRQREFAVRSALGADRARLLRQILTECTVLSLIGGAIGLGLARLLHGLVPVLAGDLPRIEEVGFDHRMFIFAFLVSALTGVAFGLAPGLSSSATDPVRMLHGGAGATVRGGRSMSVFVVVEVALAMVLLIAAALLLRGFLGLVTVDPGYRPRGVATVRLEVDPGTLGSNGWSGRPLDRLLDRLAAHSAVAAAGVVSVPPLPQALSLTSVSLEGLPPGRMLAVPQMTSPGYLDAIGLRLAEGRWLTAEDHASRAPVVVVNQTFVDRFVSPAPAIGRTLVVGAASLEIVGVVEDVRLMGLDSDARPEFFASYHLANAVSGSGAADLTLIVRAEERVSELVPILRSLVPELHPDLPLGVETLSARLSASVAQPRFYALLLGGFAGMALLLAAAGLYGTLAHSVARQTRAIGIRRALGASRGDILGMVFKQGLLLVSAGLVIGVASAAGTTRILRHLVEDVPAWDPLAYSLAVLLLIGAGTLASYVPARRATELDPIDTLRSD